MAGAGPDLTELRQARDALTLAARALDGAPLPVLERLAALRLWVANALQVARVTEPAETDSHARV
jgi:hypothetical protein